MNLFTNFQSIRNSSRYEGNLFILKMVVKFGG